MGTWICRVHYICYQCVNMVIHLSLPMSSLKIGTVFVARPLYAQELNLGDEEVYNQSRCHTSHIRPQIHAYRHRMRHAGRLDKLPRGPGGSPRAGVPRVILPTSSTVERDEDGRANRAGEE